MLPAFVCVARTTAAEPAPAGKTPVETKPQDPALQPSPHDGGFGRLPHVVDLVLSADGRHLAAAYFVPAMNRPGTDWNAWVAVWNLATGERTMIPNATQPLAISPDGQWLAMGLYKRSQERGSGGRPRSELALWKVGAVEPDRKLACDIKTATWRAWTFSVDGNELLAIDEAGSLFRWDLAGKSAAEKIETVAVPGMETSAKPNDRRFELESPVDLQVARNRLVMIAPLREANPQGQSYSTEADWVKRNSKWSGYVLPRVFKQQLPNNVAFVHPQWFAGNPYALSLPAQLALPYIQAEPPDTVERPWRQDRSTRLAIAPQKHLIAFMEPGASLATVRRINGEQIAQFPGAAVHAFTPDGTKLIVSDCRGVLRFWDFAAGRIVRTLRLDDRAADTFLVAAVQAASEFGEPEKNREKLSELVKWAAYQGAQVVVLPETAVTGYMSDDLKKTWRAGDRPLTPGLEGIDPKDAAETVPGPSTRFFGKLARQMGIYLTVPLLEADRKTGQYYNTVVLLGPDGGILIHYRKVNPWPWAEQGWASEGNLGHPVVDSPFGRLGVLICFDIHEQAQATGQTQDRHTALFDRLGRREGERLVSKTLASSRGRKSIQHRRRQLDRR